MSSADRPFPAAADGASVAEFERVVAAGGVAVFPADTVYGLACDPGSAAAVARLYALKGRPPAKPAAVMCFGAAPDLPELGPRTRAALGALTPGGVTPLLPNPRRRWPLACGPDPGTLGLRVIGGPLAAIEVGAGQAPAVEALLRDAGFAPTERVRDLAGIERVAVARRSR